MTIEQINTIIELLIEQYKYFIEDSMPCNAGLIRKEIERWEVIKHKSR